MGSSSVLLIEFLYPTKLQFSFMQRSYGVVLNDHNDLVCQSRSSYSYVFNADPLAKNRLTKVSITSYHAFSGKNNQAQRHFHKRWT